MNHEALLWKYIEHVGACEGTDFLDDVYRHKLGEDFTDAEWAELQRISNGPLWAARVSS
jgi:hypothetical protein